MNIKQPYQISSDYFKLLLDAGWFPERESLVSFPHHIEILPEVVKSFLKEIWYISFSRDHYFIGRDENYQFRNDIVTFGETTKKLEDYSEKTDFTEEYISMVNCNIANFGDISFREILIDEYGKIYHIPDSGDLYVMEGKFYEGVFNLVYNEGTTYMVADGGKLLYTDKTTHKLIDTGLTLDDIR